MSNYFQEWAQKYDNSAAILKNSIQTLKQKLKTAPPEELSRINYDISVLKAMRRDTTEIAEELRKKHRHEMERLNETTITIPQ